MNQNGTDRVWCDKGPMKQKRLEVSRSQNKDLCTLSFFVPHSFFFPQVIIPKQQGKQEKTQAPSLINQRDINNSKPQATKIESGWKDGA